MNRLCLAALVMSACGTEPEKTSDTGTSPECATTCDLPRHRVESADDLAEIADCSCIDGEVVLAPQAGVVVDLPDLRRIYGGLVFESPFDGEVADLPSLLSVRDLKLTGAAGPGSVVELTALEAAGVVTVLGGGVTTLSLPALTRSETVRVEGAPALTGLALPALASVDRVILQSAEALTAVTMGTAVEAGDITIEANPLLDSLSGGLDKLEGDLVVTDNPVLAELPWLGSVQSTTIGALELSGNASLASVGVLERVERIDGQLKVTENPSLVTFDSLPALREIHATADPERGLDIIQNASLTTLELPLLAYVEGGITVMRNPCLDDTVIQDWPLAVAADAFIIIDNGGPEACP